MGREVGAAATVPATHSLFLAVSCVPIIQEFLVTDIGQRVLEHLGYHAERHRRNVCSHACRVNYVDRTANACHQYLGLEIVVVEDLDQLSDQFHPDMANVVQASDKRTDEGSAGLCRDNGL